MLVTFIKASSVKFLDYPRVTMNSTRTLLLALLHFVILQLAHSFQLSKPHAASLSMRSKIASSKGIVIESSQRLCQHAEQKINHMKLYMAAESDGSGNKVETKYVTAGIVFVLACLFDFFIVHGGQTYLVHP